MVTTDVLPISIDSMSIIMALSLSVTAYSAIVRGKKREEEGGKKVSHQMHGQY